MRVPTGPWVLDPLKVELEACELPEVDAGNQKSLEKKQMLLPAD